MKRTINSKDLKKMVAESIARILKEHDPDDPDFGQLGDWEDMKMSNSLFNNRSRRFNSYSEFLDFKREYDDLLEVSEVRPVKINNGSISILLYPSCMYFPSDGEVDIEEISWSTEDESQNGMIDPATEQKIEQFIDTRFDDIKEKMWTYVYPQDRPNTKTIDMDTQLNERYTDRHKDGKYMYQGTGSEESKKRVKKFKERNEMPFRSVKGIADDDRPFKHPGKGHYNDKEGNFKMNPSQCDIANRDYPMTKKEKEAYGISESDIRNMVAESVKKILNEISTNEISSDLISRASKKFYQKYGGTDFPGPDAKDFPKDKYGNLLYPKDKKPLASHYRNFGMAYNKAKEREDLSDPIIRKAQELYDTLGNSDFDIDVEDRVDDYAYSINLWAEAEDEDGGVWTFEGYGYGSMGEIDEVEAMEFTAPDGTTGDIPRP